jgi:hypothetical protein
MSICHSTDTVTFHITMVRCQEHELLTQDQVQVDELTVNQVHKVVQNWERKHLRRSKRHTLASFIKAIWKMHQPASKNHNDSSTEKRQKCSSLQFEAMGNIACTWGDTLNPSNSCINWVKSAWELWKLQHPHLLMLWRSHINLQLQVNWRALLIDRHSQKWFILHQISGYGNIN